jgi:hypothetical protein
LRLAIKWSRLFSKHIKIYAILSLMKMTWREFTIVILSKICTNANHFIERSYIRFLDFLWIDWLTAKLKSQNNLVHSICIATIPVWNYSSIPPIWKNWLMDFCDTRNLDSGGKWIIWGREKRFFFVRAPKHINIVESNALVFY